MVTLNLHSDASPPTLSPLSQEDKALLLEFFQCNEDPIALAGKTGADFVDILSWTFRPEIAAYIAHARRLRLDAQRCRALDALEQLLKTATDPTERRRAATTILRATDPRRTLSSPRPASPDSGNGASHLPSGRGHSVNHADDQAVDLHKAATPSCIDRYTATILSLFSQGDELEAAAALLLASDRDLLIQGQPAPDDLHQFAQSLRDSPLAPLLNHTVHTPAQTTLASPTEHIHSTTITTADGSQEVRVDFRFVPPERSSHRPLFKNIWRLTHIQIAPAHPP